MTVSTMTGEDLIRIYKKDEIKIKWFCVGKAKDLLRDLRKGFVYVICIFYKCEKLKKTMFVSLLFSCYLCIKKIWQIVGKEEANLHVLKGQTGKSMQVIPVH